MTTMKILMVSNTYLPDLSGVAGSVASFTESLRDVGHRVLVVAPDYGVEEDDEEDVIRVPAIEDFHGSGYAVALPLPGYVEMRLGDFHPTLVHAHSPFLLGGTAMRIAAEEGVPLVFTHHTMYEHYTHYAPGDSEALRDYVVDFATRFANLCDGVVAPSESLAELLRGRGVRSRLFVVPTGVDVFRFSMGHPHRWRDRFGIASDAFLLGHVGRLAPEKNVDFLARSVARVLDRHDDAHLLVVGDGSRRSVFREVASDHVDRIHETGAIDGDELVDAYHNMDCFVFTSKTETQGIVLAEAMASGLPVVALGAPAVRDVVRDGVNGRLVEAASEEDFARAIEEVLHDEASCQGRFRRGARATAASFSLDASKDRLLRGYETVLRKEGAPTKEPSTWTTVLKAAETEFVLWKSMFASLSTVILGDDDAGIEP